MASLRPNEFSRCDLNPDNLLVVSLSAELDTMCVKHAAFGAVEEPAQTKGAAPQEVTPTFTAPRCPRLESRLPARSFLACLIDFSIVFVHDGWSWKPKTTPRTAVAPHVVVGWPTVVEQRPLPDAEPEADLLKRRTEKRPPHREVTFTQRGDFHTER